jgi:hypothetical protein
MLECEFQSVKNQQIFRASKVEKTYAIGDPTSSGDVVETQGEPATFMSFIFLILFQQRKTRFSFRIVIHTLLQSCNLSCRKSLNQN